MNLLQRALIEKAGHDNGFEHVLPSPAGEQVLLGSARHGAEVQVIGQGSGFIATICRSHPALSADLARSFPSAVLGDDRFELPDEASLARCLRRAAAPALALPSQAVTTFEAPIAPSLPRWSQLQP